AIVSVDIPGMSDPEAPPAPPVPPLPAMPPVPPTPAVPPAPALPPLPSIPALPPAISPPQPASRLATLRAIPSLRIPCPRPASFSPMRQVGSYMHPPGDAARHTCSPHTKPKRNRWHLTCKSRREMKPTITDAGVTWTHAVVTLPGTVTYLRQSDLW